MPYFSEAILIDTSAALAILNPEDKYHKQASSFFISNSNILWISNNATAQESYTRARYDLGFNISIQIYNFLTNKSFHHINFKNNDEKQAKSLLIKYQEHKISFHDALCTAIMKRLGIYKVFTFDKHFYIFGFQVLPGF